jgi:hypothetical protein
MKIAIVTIALALLLAGAAPSRAEVREHTLILKGVICSG